MDENPFQVLGILPSALKGLTDEQITVLIRGVYRTLSRIKHPDVGGSDKSFHRINQAFKELDISANSARFRYWKELYLKPKKDKVALLENKVEEIYADKALLIRVLGSIVESFSQFDNDPLSVGNIRSTSFILSDWVERSIAAKIPRGRRHNESPSNTRENSLAYEFQPLCEVVVGADGRLVRYNLGRTPYVNERHKDTSPHYYNQTRTVGYTLFREDEGVRLSGRLIGCISSDWKFTVDPETKAISNSRYRRLEGILPSEVGVETYQNRLTGFPIESFGLFLPFWTSRVKFDYTLVASASVGGEIKLVMLGEIKSITSLEE